MEKVRIMLQTGTVYASIAPSFAASYPGVGIDALEDALKKLGFAGAEETAVGATIVKKEYERILDEEKPNILVSSCCSSINLMLRKYLSGGTVHAGAGDHADAGALQRYKAQTS